MSAQAAIQSTLTGRAGARARRCTVRVEADGIVYVGKMYIPDGKRRVSDVLADDRSFLSLTDVAIDGAELLDEGERAAPVRLL